MVFICSVSLLWGWPAQSPFGAGYHSEDGRRNSENQWAESGSGSEEGYLRVPAVSDTATRPIPVGIPTRAAEDGEELSFMAWVTQEAERLECSREVYLAIRAASEKYRVPLNILLEVSWHESRHQPTRRRLVGEHSIGLFQFNQRGGLGIGHSEADLLHPIYNADLAARIMAERFGETKDWYRALAPWSVRGMVRLQD